MPMRLPELIIIFVVALLVFGPKKLPEMGASLARTINEFKRGMSDLGNHTNDDVLHTENAAIEARRLELEALEREIASKKAAATAYESYRPEVPASSYEAAEPEVSLNSYEVAEPTVTTNYYGATPKAK